MKENAKRTQQAKEFVEYWSKAEGSEERESRSFWIEFCQMIRW